MGSERRTEIDRIREEGGVKEVKKKKNEKSDGCLNHAKDRRVSCEGAPNRFVKSTIIEEGNKVSWKITEAKSPGILSVMRME